MIGQGGGVSQSAPERTAFFNENDLGGRGPQQMGSKNDAASATASNHDHTRGSLRKSHRRSLLSERMAKLENVCRQSDQVRTRVQADGSGEKNLFLLIVIPDRCKATFCRAEEGGIGITCARRRPWFPRSAHSGLRSARVPAPRASLPGR